MSRVATKTKKPQVKALAAVVEAPVQTPAGPDLATVMTAIAAIAAEVKELKVERRSY